MEKRAGKQQKDWRVEQIRQYHLRTKHQPNRFAAGPTDLDWKSQPEPFRWFVGSDQIDLLLVADSLTTPYSHLHTPASITPHPLTIKSISALLELSLGLSAWKSYGGDRWALRCNPSSGNLHPIESYLLLPNMNGLDAGLYHYLSRDHQLEKRCKLTGYLPCAESFLLGLSTVHWRETWKYGERSYRYCQLNSGHALAAIHYSAALLGWSVQDLAHWGDEEIATFLGLDRETDFPEEEGEYPELLLQIGYGKAPEPLLTPSDLFAHITPQQWQGQANPLSTQHSHSWPLVETTATAIAKPPQEKPSALRHPEQAAAALPLPLPLTGAPKQTAATLIRQRRSGQAFDGETTIRSASLYRILDMTLPRPGMAPWGIAPSPAQVHLLLFVHRVVGLTPGLYLLPRRATALAFLQATITSPDFNWQAVSDAPDHLLLHRLLETDSQGFAGNLSCYQNIAADSAFSLGMLAEFDQGLNKGAWGYRDLLREAGMIGQVLYLEAEAAGVRGTGIGCYFDDNLHTALGINSTVLQSLYHFTIGGAVADPRLLTLPPYAHLSNRQRATL